MSFGDEQTFAIRMIDQDDEAADSARELIAKSFRSRLNAYPNADHKHYLVVETKLDDETVLAACSSLSFAHEQSLFSENYLSTQVQNAIAERVGVDSDRSAICEIGSLSTNPALIPSVKRVVAYFPWFAYRMGYEFALVTVTSYMRMALANAGASFEPLCSADPSKLSAEDRARWGSYYDYDPQTGIIDLKHLSFLDHVARPTVFGKMVIRLGCFAKVVA